MAKGPLIPPSRVPAWERQVNDALDKALAKQRSLVFRNLGTQPGSKALTAAASKKNKRAGLVSAGALAWSINAWHKTVTEDVAPVVATVTKSIVNAAKAALPLSQTMGMPDNVAATNQAMVKRAIDVGDSIGKRVNDAIARAPDLATAADDADAAMDSAPAILDNSVGSMVAQAVATSTTDVTSYLAGFFGATYSGATKTWRTMDDDRVRPTHADAEGQEVALNDVFIVGGEAMTGPGDPSASDDETYGCRCFLETDGVLPEGTTSDLGDSDTELADDGSDDDDSEDDDDG